MWFILSRYFTQTVFTVTRFHCMLLSHPKAQEEYLTQMCSRQSKVCSSGDLEDRCSLLERQLAEVEREREEERGKWREEERGKWREEKEKVEESVREERGKWRLE